jgi:tetratricopeptide (TPR) repeat protein
VELDPDFALAHAELAMAHARLVSDRVDVSPSRIASAGAAADRALELEPGLARAHLARAVSLALATGRGEEARGELDIALASAPNDPRVLLWKGLLLLQEPRADQARSSLEEAVDAFGRVLDLDPENYQAQRALGECLGALRMYAAADLAFQRAIRLQPDRLPAYLNRYWYALAWEGGTELAREVLASVPADRHRDVFELRLFTVLAERRFDRALNMIGEMPSSWVESPLWLWPTELVECHAFRGLEQVPESHRACQAASSRIQAALENRPDDPRLWIALANSEALLGNGEGGVRAGERALELAKPTIFDQSQFIFHLAIIHAMLGNTDQAVRGLSAALERPGWFSRAWLAFDWRLDQIRDDPGFQRLAEGR